MLDALFLIIGVGLGWFAHDRKPARIVYRYRVLDLESNTYECDEEQFKYLANGVPGEEVKRRA